MLSLIMATVPTMLQSPDWKQRHAALMAVSSAGEGCHKQMEALLGEIMGGLLEFLRDPVSIEYSINIFLMYLVSSFL